MQFIMVGFVSKVLKAKWNHLGFWNASLNLLGWVCHVTTENEDF